MLAVLSALSPAGALRAGALAGRCALSTAARRRARPLLSDDESVETPPPVDASAPVSSPFLQVMKSRGYLYQCSNLAELDALMCKQVVPAYLGFDATAGSLHVGSLLQIMILRHLQKCGHKPVVLVGGGTTKIGDPSGRDTTRQMLTDEQINANIAGISKVRGAPLDLADAACPAACGSLPRAGLRPASPLRSLARAHAASPHRQVFARFLTFGDGPTDAVLVDNDEWLGQLQLLPFLRDYGRHFTINRMLAFESVKQRLGREQPLTFLEFNYMIFQVRRERARTAGAARTGPRSPAPTPRLPRPCPPRARRTTSSSSRAGMAAGCRWAAPTSGATSSRASSSAGARTARSCTR